MTKQQANQQLVAILQKLVNENPDLRFSQILDVYGFIRSTRPANPELGVEWRNEFYTEPEVVLKRVKVYLEDEDT